MKKERVIELLASNNIDEVKKLIKNDIKQREEVINIAYVNGYNDVINILLEGLRNINDRYRRNGNSLLHFACQRGHYDVTQYLICRGADMNLTNYYGYTPLHMAIEREDIQIIEYLFNYADDNNIKININGNNNGEDTLLHVAAERGNIQIVEHLLNYAKENNIKININACNRAGDTPLHVAIERENIQIVEYLLNYANDNNIKINVNARNSTGYTPLYMAFRNKDIKIIEHLSNYAKENDIEININDCNNYGDTLLHHACIDAQYDKIKWLVQHGANVNLPNKQGNTPLLLHIKHRLGYHNIVKFLIKNGADINARNNDGDTALYMACMEGNNKFIRYLVDYAKRSNIKMDPKDIERSIAVLLNQEDRNIFEYLYNYAKDEKINEDVKIKLEENEILQNLYYKKDYKSIKCALTKGTNVDLVDNNGNSLLHIACAKGDYKFMKYLVEDKGADTKIKNKDGKTPLQLAKKHGKKDIVVYFNVLFGRSRFCKKEEVNEVLNEYIKQKSIKRDIKKIEIVKKKGKYRVILRKSNKFYEEAHERYEYDVVNGERIFTKLEKSNRNQNGISKFLRKTSKRIRRTVRNITMINKEIPRENIGGPSRGMDKKWEKLIN